MPLTINTVSVYSGAEGQQLLAGNLGSTMIQNQGSYPVQLSSTSSNNTPLLLAAGNSITWPTNTPCYVTNTSGNEVTLGIGEGVIPGVATNVNVAGTLDANIVGGSVGISGTPDVAISGTPTVDLSPGATVDISPGATVDIGTVNGNVSVVNPTTGTALVTRTLNVGADVLYTHQTFSEGSTLAPGNTFNTSISPSVGSANQLVVIAIAIVFTAPGTYSVSIGDSGSTGFSDGVYGTSATIVVPTGTTSTNFYSYCLYWYAIATSSAGLSADPSITNEASSPNSIQIQSIITLSYGATNSTGFSNPSLAGVTTDPNVVVTGTSLTGSLTLPTDSLVIASSVSSYQWTAASPGQVLAYQSGKWQNVWYNFFNSGKVSATLTSGSPPQNPTTMALAIPQ